jgi:hypothetical protein
MIAPYKNDSQEFRASMLLLIHMPFLGLMSNLSGFRLLFLRDFPPVEKQGYIHGGIITCKSCYEKNCGEKRSA